MGPKPGRRRRRNLTPGKGGPPFNLAGDKFRGGSKTDGGSGGGAPKPKPKPPPKPKPKPPPKSKGGGRSRGKGTDRTNAKPNTGKTTTKDPIDVVTGEVLLCQTDLGLPGALPMFLERTYISTYVGGGLFGTSWASTLDQRLDIEPDAIYFMSADATVLKYPQALIPNVQFRAAEGPQWPLTLTSEGGYVLSDPQSGRTLHFPPPGERHGWSSVPLVAISDRSGNRIDFVYEEQVLVEVRHSGGYRIAVDTAPVDTETTDRRLTGLRLCSGSESERHLVRYDYDDRGRLTRVTNSSGQPMRFEYDEEDRLRGWRDRNDHWYRYEYDDEDRAVRASGSDGFLDVALAYDPERRTTVVTDSLGHATTYEYNDLHQIVRETDPLGAVTRSEWDDKDQLLTRTDPLGQTVRYSYDEYGNVTSIVRPDGGRMELVLNELYLPVEIHQPDGAVWRRAYDEKGNLVQVTDPANATTRYLYDQRGNPAGSVDPLGQTTRVECDAAGLPVTVTDPLGAVTRYTHDALGRLATVTDPLGGVTRFGWTLEGKPAWRTLPDGSTERWTYDAEGNETEHVNAYGQAVSTEYGPFDLPTAQTGPDGARLEFGYDTEMRLTSVTEPQGLVWNYAYNAVGDLVAESDFNGRKMGYTYDAAGRLVGRSNGTGQHTGYVRDELGSVVEKRSGDAVTTYGYDRQGRLVHAANADVDLRLERDALGRVVAELSNGKRLEISYDALGRRTGRRTPGGLESNWTYDAAGHPAALTFGGQNVTFAHDAAGRETQRDFDIGAALIQQWDQAHRLTGQTLWGAPSPGGAGEARLHQHRTYAYRADGAVSAIGDRIRGDRRLGLDPLGRITAVQARNWSERYIYDRAGNPVSAEWSEALRSPDEELTGERAFSGTLLRRAGRTRYEYDEQGRVTLRQQARPSAKPATWRYWWDADDRLVAVRTPEGAHWWYRYDALGRRVAKQRAAGDDRQVAEQVDYTWDGTTLVEQIHTCQATAGPDGAKFERRHTAWEYESETFRPLGQIEHRSARDAPQEWIDRKFHAIVADLAGAPAELIAPGGELAWASQANIWGKEPEGREDPCPLRLPGQYHDPETGLNQNFQRYYDPGVGRYFSSDPLGLQGGLGLHSYVQNPLVHIDPLGLKGGPNETFYRGMSNAEYEKQLKAKGTLYPLHGETFVTQDKAYIEQLAKRHPDDYEKLVKFEMAPGTRDALMAAGARDKVASDSLKSMGLDGLPVLEKGNKSQVHIKTELDYLTFGLRRGSVDTFNNNIRGYDLVPGWNPRG